MPLLRCDSRPAALIIIAFALLAATATIQSASAAEFIHSYDQIVRVAKDGTLNVTETIRVRAEGRQIKHGIYRDFPLTFQDAHGGLHDVTFKLLGVKRDGHAEPYFTEGHDNGIRIYAGDKNVRLAPGDYTYVLSYWTGRQIRWFGDKPELYWNVTGNFWRFPILRATVRVQFPDRARPQRWTAYTGPLGARGHDWHGQIMGDGDLAVTTTRMLHAGEGLTIVALIPPGAVNPPSRSQRSWYAFLDYRGWIFGILGMALVLGYYAWAWSKVGRDPKGGTIIPLFHPPQGVSPALANYIRKWGLGRDRWRAFTAAALSLAVKGLLLFDDNNDKLTLKATGHAVPDGQKLPAGEAAILDWVRDQGGSAVIDRGNGTAVAEVGDSFARAIEGENRSRFFHKNVGYFIGGLVLTGLVMAAILNNGGLHDADIAIVIVMAFFGTFFGIFLIPIVGAISGVFHQRSVVGVAIPLIVILMILGFMFSELASFIPHDARAVAPLMRAGVAGFAAHSLPIALVLGFCAVNGLFLYLLRAPTDLGRKVMDQLDGLLLYIGTAESDRLNMQPPEFTAHHFEELLPYAVALNAEKPWSEAFATALRCAHPEDADPMRNYRPGWYSGNSGWSSRNFGSSFSSTVAGMSSAFSSAVPVSSSSGFGGGGGSGGGGGGGGGGGW